MTPPLAKPRFTLSTTSGDAFDFRLKTDGYVTLLFFRIHQLPRCVPTPHVEYRYSPWEDAFEFGGSSQISFCHD